MAGQACAEPMDGVCEDLLGFACLFFLVVFPVGSKSFISWPILSCFDVLVADPWRLNISDEGEWSEGANVRNCVISF